MMILMSEIIWWMYQDVRTGWLPHLGTESISSRTESILSLLSSTLTCVVKVVLIASLPGSYSHLGSTSVVWCSSISGLWEKSTFYSHQKYPTKAVIWSQSSSRPKKSLSAHLAKYCVSISQVEPGNCLQEVLRLSILVASPSKKDSHMGQFPGEIDPYICLAATKTVF